MMNIKQQIIQAYEQDKDSLTNYLKNFNYDDFDNQFNLILEKIKTFKEEYSYFNNIDIVSRDFELDLNDKKIKKEENDNTVKIKNNYRLFVETMDNFIQNELNVLDEIILEKYYCEFISVFNSEFNSNINNIDRDIFETKIVIIREKLLSFSPTRDSVCEKITNLKKELEEVQNRHRKFFENNLSLLKDKKLEYDAKTEEIKKQYEEEIKDIEENKKTVSNEINSTYACINSQIGNLNQKLYRFDMKHRFLNVGVDSYDNIMEELENFCEHLKGLWNDKEEPGIIIIKNLYINPRCYDIDIGGINNIVKNTPNFEKFMKIIPILGGSIKYLPKSRYTHTYVREQVVKEGGGGQGVYTEIETVKKRIMVNI